MRAGRKQGSPPRRNQGVTAEDFQLRKDQIERGADNLGRVLLAGTHPTGKYEFTFAPDVTLSDDKQRLVVAVTVRWRGGITDSPYDTSYVMTVAKQSGLEALLVVRDTAFVNIKPLNLRQTENTLRGAFPALR